jgi:hypothetical protein
LIYICYTRPFMALGDQIQGVQAEALQALELELAGDLESAAEAYTRATTQLQYLLDVCVPQTQAAGDLSTVCRGLLNGYACRMEVRAAWGCGAWHSPIFTPLATTS